MLLRRCPKASLREIANEFGICATPLCNFVSELRNSCNSSKPFCSSLLFSMLCFLFDQLNKRTAKGLQYALSPGVFRHRKVIWLKDIIAWDCVGALRCIITIWHQIPQLHSFLYLLDIRMYICFSSYCIWAGRD